MRLWSIHPKYLDTKGLLAVWREGLLAQSVLLKGEYTNCPICYIEQTSDEYIDIKLPSEEWITEEGKCRKCKGTKKIKTAYWNHPQLDRWKIKPIESLKNYLYCICEEAEKRGYNFNVSKIKLEHDDWIVDCPHDEYFMTVTQGQLDYEYAHLQKKLKNRDYEKYKNNISLTFQELVINDKEIEPHPLFKVIEGDIESWEKLQEVEKKGVRIN